MTTEQLKELQEMTAKFLGWEIMPYTEGNCYSHPRHPCDVRVLEDFDLEDWNFIMKVVQKIQLLDIVHDNTRSFDSVFKEWQCTFSPSYKTHDFGYIVGRSKTSEKRAVLEAIYEFLKWYQDENKTDDN
jgi:hypothetical protein